MKTKVDETAVAPSLPEGAEPPPDPVGLARLLLQQLAAIPWVGLGAIGTGVGVALLAFYFRSIDFVPPDISSVLGASVFVAMLAFAFYLWVLVSLVGPLWAYRAAKLPPQQEASEQGFCLAANVGLPALQVLGVGGFLLIVLGVPAWRECRPYAGWTLAICGVLALLGGAVWAWSEWRTRGQRPAWWWRLPAVLWVCLWGVLPMGALLALLWPSQGAGWQHLWTLGGLWLGVVIAPLLLRRIPVWGCALMITTMFPALAISLPLFLGSPSLFPTKIAELAGVRSKGALELRVPASTCLLIDSALEVDHRARYVNCNERGWSSVHAQVLANLGPRWLIQLAPKNAGTLAGESMLRLTVPAEGVHIVQRPPVPKTTSADSCPR